MGMKAKTYGRKFLVASHLQLKMFSRKLKNFMILLKVLNAMSWPQQMTTKEPTIGSSHGV
jgi:hypothetical protein